jgi:hypothetical protein
LLATFDDDEEEGESGIEGALLEDYYGGGADQEEGGLGLRGGHDSRGWSVFLLFFSKCSSCVTDTMVLSSVAGEHEARWLPQYDYDDEEQQGNEEEEGFGLGFSMTSVREEEEEEEEEKGGPKERRVEQQQRRRVRVGSEDSSDSSDSECEDPPSRSFGHYGMGAARGSSTADVEMESYGQELEEEVHTTRSALDCDSFDLLNDPQPLSAAPFSTGNLLGLEDYAEPPLVPREDLLHFEALSSAPSSASLGSHRPRSSSHGSRNTNARPLISNSDAIALTARDRRDMADLDRAWADMDEDLQESSGEEQEQQEQELIQDAPRPSAEGGESARVAPSLQAPETTHRGTSKHSHIGTEQRAQWYDGQRRSATDDGPSSPFFNPHYIPIIAADEDLDDRRPADEKVVRTKILVKMRATFKVRLFEGGDWMYPSTRHHVSAVRSAVEKQAELVVPSHPSIGRLRQQQQQQQQLNKSVRFTDVKRNMDKSATPSVILGQSGAASVMRAADGAKEPKKTQKPLFDDHKVSVLLLLRCRS